MLADDHPSTLLGNRLALAGTNTISVVGMVHNSTELVALLETQPCDVLVTDFFMPGGDYGDGIAMLEYVQRHYPKVKIAVATMLEGPLVLRPLIRIGVHCIVSKTDEASHLIPAVHVASAGGSYFSPRLVEMARMLEQQMREGRAPEELTMRELEVIRYYVSGMTWRDIARVLKRSKQTISTQKVSAMKKLGVERDADLLKYALEVGLAGAAYGRK